MPPVATISYLRGTQKSKPPKPGAKPKLNITVPTSVFISKAKLFRVMLGTGEDRGKIRIMAVAENGKGGVKPHEFKSHLIFRFGHAPVLGEDIFDGAKCPIARVSIDVYDLTVPDAILPPLNAPATTTHIHRARA